MAREPFNGGVVIAALFDSDHGVEWLLTRYSLHAFCCGVCAVVSTLAGGVNNATGTFADGTGSNAGFNGLFHLTVDVSGNVYVADGFNQRLRKVTPVGGTWTSSLVDEWVVLLLVLMQLVSLTRLPSVRRFTNCPMVVLVDAVSRPCLISPWCGRDVRCVRFFFATCVQWSPL